MKSYEKSKQLQINFVLLQQNKIVLPGITISF